MTTTKAQWQQWTRQQAKLSDIATSKRGTLVSLIGDYNPDNIWWLHVPSEQRDYSVSAIDFKEACIKFSEIRPDVVICG